MSEYPTEFTCSNCEKVVKPSGRSEFCPDCGEEDPWEEQAVFDFERDVELPLIFDYEVADDSWGLWPQFCGAAFDAGELTGSDIVNLPDNLPRMDGAYFMVYWKLTEDLELKGPFLDKSEARNA